MRGPGPFCGKNFKDSYTWAEVEWEHVPLLIMSSIYRWKKNPDPEPTTRRGTGTGHIRTGGYEWVRFFRQFRTGTGKTGTGSTCIRPKPEPKPEPVETRN
ncbi:hypothetical protein R6Q59_008122 [Mikania micrantha]